MVPRDADPRPLFGYRLRAVDALEQYSERASFTVTAARPVSNIRSCSCSISDVQP